MFVIHVIYGASSDGRSCRASWRPPTLAACNYIKETILGPASLHQTTAVPRGQGPASRGRGKSGDQVMERVKRDERRV